MKRHLVPVFCSVLLFGAWIAIVSAQAGGVGAAQLHIAKARAAAYEPGQDLIDVFETLCEPAIADRGPQIPNLQVAPSLAARKVPPRFEWYS